MDHSVLLFFSFTTKAMWVAQIRIEDLDTIVKQLSDKDSPIMMNSYIIWIVKLKWLRSLGANSSYKVNVTKAPSTVNTSRWWLKKSATIMWPFCVNDNPSGLLNSTGSESGCPDLLIKCPLSVLMTVMQLFNHCWATMRWPSCEMAIPWGLDSFARYVIVFGVLPLLGKDSANENYSWIWWIKINVAKKCFNACPRALLHHSSVSIITHNTRHYR